MKGTLIRLLKKNKTGLTLARFFDALHNYDRKEVVGNLNKLVADKSIQLHTINSKELSEYMGLRIGSELYLLTTQTNGNK